MIHRSILRGRRARAALEGDSGIALPMVLLVFLVGVALISAFLVAIVGSSQVTATNKSILQAQGFAEAGIAAAEIAMSEDPCGVDLNTITPPTGIDYHFTSERPVCVTENDPVTGDPRKTVTVKAVGVAGETNATVEATYLVVRESEDVDEPGDYLVYAGGFSNSEFDGDLVLHSDGLPTDVTVAKSPYYCTSHTSPGDVYVGSSAYLNGCILNGSLYLSDRLLADQWSENSVGGASTVSGNISAAGTGSHIFFGTAGGDISVNGSFTLHWGSVVEGSVSVSGTGNAVIQGTVRGDVVVGGNATISGIVEGDVIVAGDGETIVSGTVRGSVRTEGRVTVNDGGRIRGSLTAAGLDQTTFLKGPVEGDVRVNGRLSVDQWHIAFPGRFFARGQVSLIGGNSVGAGLDGCVIQSVTGPINWNQPSGNPNLAVKTCTLQPSQLDFTAGTGPTAITAPPAVSGPNIEGWRDYTYKSADWPGYDIEVVKENHCKGWEGHPGQRWNQLKNLKDNTVFDLSACDNISTNGAQSQFKDEEIGVDVVFILNKANLNGFQLKAKPGTDPSVWFIQEGESRDGSPQCPAGTPTSITFEGTKIDSSVTTMLYTPCNVHISRSDMTGNLYVGSVTTGGKSTINFSHIAMPGWGSTGGTGGGGAPAAGGEVLHGLLVQRNID